MTFLHYQMNLIWLKSEFAMISVFALLFPPH